MKLIRFVEKNVSLILLIGIPLGLLFPFFGFLKWSLKYILMFVLFVSFLKIDFTELFMFLKKPLLPLYVTVSNLLIIPAIIFFSARLLITEKSLLAAVLLLSAVPSGVASAAMTELSEGDGALTLVITIFSHFLAPASIPLLFYVLLGEVVKLNYAGISLTMAELILVPFGFALAFKTFFRKTASEIVKIGTFLTAVPISFISLIVMSVNAPFIYKHPVSVLKYLAIIYPIYFIFGILGLAESFFLNNKQKIAVANSKVFMNVSIGIVLAMQFFEPKTALIITLAQIPWPTMLGPMNFIYKKLHLR